MNAKRKILVVDDEPSIRSLYHMAFAHGGHQVLVAESGEDALEQMRKTPCDLLFLDLNLPGINGNELCQRVQLEWPQTSCIAVTGYTSRFEESACFAAGFKQVLKKPISLSDLLRAVEAG